MYLRSATAMRNKLTSDNTSLVSKPTGEADHRSNVTSVEYTETYPMSACQHKHVRRGSVGQMDSHRLDDWMALAKRRRYHPNCER